MTKTLFVNCPVCHTAIEWCETQVFRPFCSERCRLMDLGEWATGGYSIAGEPEDAGLPDDEVTIKEH